MSANLRRAPNSAPAEYQETSTILRDILPRHVPSQGGPKNVAWRNDLSITISRYDPRGMWDIQRQVSLRQHLLETPGPRLWASTKLDQARRDATGTSRAARPIPDPKYCLTITGNTRDSFGSDTISILYAIILVCVF